MSETVRIFLPATETANAVDYSYRLPSQGWTRSARKDTTVKSSSGGYMPAVNVEKHYSYSIKLAPNYTVPAIFVTARRSAASGGEKWSARASVRDYSADAYGKSRNEAAANALRSLEGRCALATTRVKMEAEEAPQATEEAANGADSLPTVEEVNSFYDGVKVGTLVYCEDKGANCHVVRVRDTPRGRCFSTPGFEGWDTSFYPPRPDAAYVVYEEEAPGNSRRTERYYRQTARYEAGSPEAVKAYEEATGKTANEPKATEEAAPEAVKADDWRTLRDAYEARLSAASACEAARLAYRTTKGREAGKVPTGDTVGAANAANEYDYDESYKAAHRRIDDRTDGPITLFGLLARACEASARLEETTPYAAANALLAALEDYGYVKNEDRAYQTGT